MDPKSSLMQFAESFCDNFILEGEPIKEVTEGVLIYGVGGSAIAGDIFKNLVMEDFDFPIILHRNYIPPKFINQSWLVIGISYSGYTEETLEMTRHFIAQDNKMVIITTGGELDKIAQKLNIPTIKISKNLQPRDAFFHIFGVICGLFSTFLNLNITLIQKELTEHQERLKSQKYQLNLQEISKQLIGKRIIIVSPYQLNAVGYRFACQLNENSKLHASTFEVPEYSHNGIVAYDGVHNTDIQLIIIRSKFEHPRVSLQLNYLEDLREKRGLENLAIVFESKGNNLLIEILKLIADFDYITLFLAENQNIDAREIKAISELKKKLRKN